MKIEDLTLEHLEAMIAGVKQIIAEHEQDSRRYRRVDQKTCAFCVVDKQFSSRMCTACPPLLILNRKCQIKLTTDERLTVFIEDYLPALEAELARRNQ